MSREGSFCKLPRSVRCYGALNWQTAVLAAWLKAEDMSYVTLVVVTGHSVSQRETPELILFPRDDDVENFRPIIVDALASLHVRSALLLRQDATVQESIRGTELEPFCEEQCSLKCTQGQHVVSYAWNRKIEARAGTVCQLEKSYSCEPNAKRRRVAATGTMLLQQHADVSAEATAVCQRTSKHMPISRLICHSGLSSTLKGQESFDSNGRC